MRRIFVTFSLIVIPLIAEDRAAAADAPSEQKANMFQFIWGGLKNNRDNLRRGIFTAKGRKVDDDPTWGRLDGEVKIFCAFDYEKGLLRFDREEPERRSKKPIPLDKEQNRISERNPKNASDPKKSWTLESTGDKWVKKESQCIAWTKDSNTVGIYRPHEEPSATLKPFDVRTLGLLIWGNLEKATSWKDTYDNYANPPKEITEERKGIWRFRWLEGSQPPLRTTVWVNESHGFSPIRLHLQQGRQVKDGTQWADPSVSSEIESVQFGDTWVPRSFRIEDRESEPRIMSYELTFNWESVNDPVAESLFTVEGMDLPKGTLVMDFTLGKPILKGRIGEDMHRGGHPPYSFLRRYGVWLLIVGAGAVAAILAYWRFRSARVPS